MFIAANAELYFILFRHNNNPNYIIRFRIHSLLKTCIPAYNIYVYTYMITCPTVLFIFIIRVLYSYTNLTYIRYVHFVVYLCVFETTRAPFRVDKILDGLQNARSLPVYLLGDFNASSSRSLAVYVRAEITIRVHGVVSWITITFKYLRYDRSDNVRFYKIGIGKKPTNHDYRRTTKVVSFTTHH